MTARHWRSGAVLAGGVAAFAAAAGPLSAQPTLQYIDFMEDGIDVAEGLERAYAGAFTSDGEFLYVPTTQDNKISVFDRDAGTGLLTQVQVIPANITGDTADPPAPVAPVHAEVSADDAHVYIAGWVADLLFVYERDGTTGELTEVEQVTDSAIDGMAYFTQTSDTSHLLGAAFEGDSLVVFERNAADGTVSVVDRVFSGDVPARALDAPIYPLMSPDDAYLYVANSGDPNATGPLADDSISIFSFNKTTGELAYEDTVFNGDGGVTGLDGTRWLEFSKDGEFLYATGLDAASLVVFDVDPATGGLTHLDTYTDTTALEAARVVSISPDGKTLLVNGYFGNTVLQFSRDLSTGLLTLENSYQNAFVPGAYGFAETRDIVFSPNGEHVYMVSWGDSGIGIYTGLQQELGVPAGVWGLY